MTLLGQPTLTLQAYLAWENEQPEKHEVHRVEAFRRGADDLWVLHDMSDGEVLEAASIGARVSLADVFAGIDPPADAAPT